MSRTGSGGNNHDPVGGKQKAAEKNVDVKLQREVERLVNQLSTGAQGSKAPEDFML